MATITRRSFIGNAAGAAAIMALGCAGLAGCSGSGDDGKKDDAKTEAPSTRKITDMVGREVEIPVEVKTVATFGSVGVLNAFVECMGKGDLLANEMPASFTKSGKWDMQYKFAPQIKGAPLLETADGIDMEATLNLAPDLCITMMEDMAQQLEENGLATIVLTWNDTEDVKTAVTLMGDVLGAEDRANEYNQYFDDMVKKASDTTKSLADADRKSVIYGDVEALKNPHIISEWWITAAGGNSVTKEAHKKNSLEYTREQLLSWQPQVIFSSNTDTAAIYADGNIADLPAVRDKQIFVVPTVAHVWGNRTVEQPLTVMWAMNKMYPDLYAESDLKKDIRDFYQRFFEYNLSDEELDSIVNYAVKK